MPGLTSPSGVVNSFGALGKVAVYLPVADVYFSSANAAVLRNTSAEKGSVKARNMAGFSG
jgi:hypothetical protein